MTPTERLWAKVDKTETCWLWTGATNGDEGYGQIKWGTKVLYAHRVVYEMLVGPIPAGLQLDHLCRVRHCVNPDHLEPVTRRENILRGEGPTAIAARSTHCAEGHPLSGENLRRGRRGDRVCLECRRTRLRRWRSKQRAGL